MPISIDSLRFNDQGLIAAIAQDHLSGEVRMMAWMDREAVRQTLATRKATFFSRSRARLWVKGEESGNVLWVKELLADCDADTLLLLCEPAGPSCHTGRDNCFFRVVSSDEPTAANPSDTEDQSAAADQNATADQSDGPAVKPFIEKLEALLHSRKASSGDKSYTRSLFDGGAVKIGAKVREEAGEFDQALANESDERVASEAADVLYHLLVGLGFRDLSFRNVLAVLAERFGTGGHVEKASRS